MWLLELFYCFTRESQFNLLTGDRSSVLSPQKRDAQSESRSSPRLPLCSREDGKLISSGILEAWNSLAANQCFLTEWGAEEIWEKYFIFFPSSANKQGPEPSIRWGILIGIESWEFELVSDRAGNRTWISLLPVSWSIRRESFGAVCLSVSHPPRSAAFPPRVPLMRSGGQYQYCCFYSQSCGKNNRCLPKHLYYPNSVDNYF